MFTILFCIFDPIFTIALGWYMNRALLAATPVTKMELADQMGYWIINFAIIEHAFVAILRLVLATCLFFNGGLV